jgi:hypothetical protein
MRASLKREKVMSKSSSLSLSARRAKHAFEKTKKGRAAFIAGTIELATELSTSRKKLPSDQAFGAWLAKAGLASISKDDRAALILIGQHVAKARKFFETQDDRWSWRSCASDISSQLTIAATNATSVMTTYAEAKPVTLHVTHAPVSQAAKPTGQLLIASQPQPQEQLEPPEFLAKPEAGAVTAVQDVIAASSLAAESVARYIEQLPPEFRPSQDQIDDAGNWLKLVARTLRDDDGRRSMH